ncbi:hypothetical protein FEDK69T_28510 [Flavobacterium enshiense DK69]|uniref:Branched-chain amino acid aminotransferase n=1 Tax=Flavobacterium enshiense DK69 TaxID=1107311 RepID=V6S1Q7_9FLAO|nr:DUF4920 domain-containing protein [Flavobacterium enshiense]ESU20334.1 hypothetical protein FEDK69T_28510 [Flavobacterium enshiense DK69]KGO95854.1 branched-chain amino acid aminotransferase [Flavobacterium enshiense DK69]
MKKVAVLAFSVFAFISCNKKQEEANIADVKKVDYAVFGDSITDAEALTKEEMFSRFKNLKEGDTLNVKFKSNIKEVCQNKGCWMSMDLAEGNETFVKFKDYAFFVPMNAGKQEAVVNGKAFVSIETVADQKHYAKDAGKSQASIDSITTPKVTYAFMADGVLIAK